MDIQVQICKLPAFPAFMVPLGGSPVRAGPLWKREGAAGFGRNKQAMETQKGKAVSLLYDPTEGYHSGGHKIETSIKKWLPGQVTLSSMLGNPL